jgi:hypothetical protein
VTVEANVAEFAFDLPSELPRGELLEFEAQTIKPKDAGLSPDIRDLGVIVFELRAQ